MWTCRIADLPEEEYCLSLGGAASAAGDTGFQNVRTDEEKAQVLSSIREGLKTGMTDPELFIDREDLQVEMTAVIRAIVEGDAAPYYRHEIDRGCTFQRGMAQALANDRRARGMLTENADAVAAMTDEELYSLLWESAEEHGFSIHAIDTSQIYLGRGFSQLTGGEAWPYNGHKGMGSRFIPPSGPLMAAEHEEVDSSSRSAFIRMRVLWANNGVGLIRVNFYHDDGAWRPRSISIACEGKEWPWPMF